MSQRTPIVVVAVVVELLACFSIEQFDRLDARQRMKMAYAFSAHPTSCELAAGQEVATAPIESGVQRPSMMTATLDKFKPSPNLSVDWLCCQFASLARTFDRVAL